MNNNNVGTISNGSCMSRTGYRTLSFESDLSLSPVIYAVHSGYQTDRGTVQRRGGIVLTFRWGHGDGGTLYRQLDDGTERPVIQWTKELQSEASRLSNLAAAVSYDPIQQEARHARALHDASRSGDWEIWVEIQSRHPWVRTFLAESGRGSSFIPEEVVPPSEYLAVKAKANRIARFKARFGVVLPHATMTSPKAGLKYEPRQLDFDPNKYVGHEKTWSGNLVNIYEGETWYGSNGFGKAVELEVTPEGEYGSNYAHSKTGHQVGKPGIIGWQGHRYLIRVKRGAYCRNHHSYGVKVDVYDIALQTAPKMVA